MIRPPELSGTDPLVWSPGRGSDVWETLRAAAAGDVSTLERLVDADPSLLRCQYRYQTPLAFAVREDHVDAAAFLLDRGARAEEDVLDVAEERGYTEMFAMLETRLAGTTGYAPDGEVVAAAIRARDSERVRALLDESPERVHAADRAGNRPIHWAVMTRQPALIDELAGRGADLEAERPDGARPVQLTNGDYAYRGWRDVPEGVAVTPRQVLDHLRAKGAHVDMCTACHVGDRERVRELLSEDAALANRPSDYITYYPCSGTPLRNAAGAGHIEIVRVLLEHGADPNLPEEHIAPRGHALHAAVCGGHHEIAEILLERGALPNVEIESSADTLSAALAREDDRMVELLCTHGAARGAALLAYYDDLVTAAAVFDANPELADDGEALRYAASESFVRLMLHHRPELPRRVTVAKTPDVTRLLFERGMDPDRRDWLNATELHRLAEQGDVENIRLFAEHGATLDAVDEEHRSTPLGWAARVGQVEAVGVLLELGADADLPDEPEWARPRAWARRRGHPDVVALLEAAGGR